MNTTDTELATRATSETGGLRLRALPLALALAAFGLFAVGQVIIGAGVFSDDFETGDLSAWTSSSVEAGNILEATTASAANGTFGLHVRTLGSNDDATTQSTIVATNEIYTRAYVKLVWDVSAGNHQPFMAAATAGSGGTVGAVAIRRTPDDLNNSLYSLAGGSYSDTGLDLSLNTWYCVEMQITISPAAGRSRVWVDGLLVEDRQNLDNGSTPISWLRLGADSASVVSNYYFDDFLADGARVGCGPDIVPPTVSAIGVNADPTEATITWTTNEPATSQIEYGTTAALGTFTTMDQTLVTSHSVTLTGLSLLETYHYQVRSLDGNGNLAVSPQPPDTFWGGDITPPVISEIEILTGSADATVRWTTDEPATSQIEYGSTAALGTFTSLDSSQVTSHSVDLTGLTHGVTYYYQVLSQDSNSNLTVTPSPAAMFVTSDLFVDGFESGDTSQWSSGVAEAGNLLEVVSEAAWRGNYGLHVRTGTTNDDAYVRRQIAGQTNVYAKVNVRLVSDFDKGGHSHLLAAATAADGSLVGSLAVRNTLGDPANSLFTVAAGSYSDTSFDFVPSVWYCVEMQLTVSPTAGRIRVWVDGFLEDDRQGLDTNSTAVSWLRVGADEATVNSELYFDDFVIDTARIGCSDGSGSDVTPPAVSSIQVTPGSGEATITWATNEPAWSQVEYGATAEMGSFTAAGQSLLTSHSVTVTRLLPQLDYHYKVISKDAELNTAAGPTPPDTFQVPIPNPYQVHLSTSSGDPSTETTFTWRTEASTASFVRMGVVAGAYTMSAQGTEYSYPNLDAGTTVDGMQVAQVNGLSPATRYYYQVGSDADGWSSEYSFATAPPKGSAAAFTFVTYGDQGTLDETSARQPRAVSAAVNAADPDLVLVPGDIFYCADGDQACVDVYFNEIVADVASQAYFMASPGNHEFIGPDDLISYTSRLNYPGRAPGEICAIASGRCPRNELPELWYSFDWGNAHFISINLGIGHWQPFSGSEEIEPGEAQYEWFKADLEAAKADPDIDWTIVVAHYSLYNWGKDGHHASDDEARAVLEPLVQENGVDLWIGAHQHSYERTLPVGDNGASVDTASCGSFPYSTCNDPSYPIYLLSGVGGRSLYEASVPTCGSAANCDGWRGVENGESFGIVKVTVSDKTMNIQFVDIEGNVLDDATINRP